MSVWLGWKVVRRLTYIFPSQNGNCFFAQTNNVEGESRAMRCSKTVATDAVFAKYELEDRAGNLCNGIKIDV